LLDEPTAGVDPTARRDFWGELHRLASQGISVLVSTHYMDEAERCHKLAFIALGKLLVQGTAAEVVASQHLSTWSIHGEHLAELSQQLQGKPGVDQTVVFGSSIHAIGHDATALQKSVTEAAKAAGLSAEPIDTGIEDVFIYLMSKAIPAHGSPAS
jgi:ABC-2 type transport system ATP-binding protein